MAKFEGSGPRDSGKKFNKSEPDRSPRANRTSPEFQKSYKERKDSRPEGFTSGQRSPSFDQARRTDRPGVRAKREAPPDNVSLNLSPRLMELAQELAEESKMNIKAYLTEALKYVLLAHGKRLGKSEKFVNEFVSTNSSPVNTWRPVSEQSDQAESAQSEMTPSESAQLAAPRPRLRPDSRMSTDYSQRRDSGRSAQGDRQERFGGLRRPDSQGDRSRARTTTRTTTSGTDNSAGEATRRPYSGSQGSRFSGSRTGGGSSASGKSYGAKSYGAESAGRFNTRSSASRSRPEADGDKGVPRARRTENGASGNSFASSRSRAGSSDSQSRTTGKPRSNYSGTQAGYGGYNQSAGSQSRSAGSRSQSGRSSSGSYGANRTTGAGANRARPSNNSQTPRRPRTGGGGARPVNRSR